MTSQTHSYVAVTDRVKIGIFHLQQLHRKNKSYLFLRFLYKSKWRLTAPTLALLVLIALLALIVVLVAAGLEMSVKRNLAIRHTK